MPAKKAAATLTEEILAAARDARRGPGNWFDALPADVRQEVEAIRDRWRAGGVPANQTALAKAVRESLAARGLMSVRWQEVAKWLAGR